MLITALAWITLWSLATGSAQANQAKESNANVYLRQANKHVDAGVYERAFVVLAQGLAMHPREPRLLQLRASLLLETRDFEAALPAFEALLSAKLSRPNRRKVRNIVRRLHRLGNTAVAIDLNVAADVYVDHKALGKACQGRRQCRKGLLPGSYRIFVEQPGFFPVRKRVRLRRNRMTRVAVELKELPSPFTVTVHPSDAQVSIDGIPWQPSVNAHEADGGNGDTLPPGEHVIQVQRPGYFTETTTITARLGQPVAIDIALDRRLPIRVSPPGAKLTLDGLPIELEQTAVELYGMAHRPTMSGVLRLPHRGRDGQALSASAAATSPNQPRRLVVHMDGYQEAQLLLPTERPIHIVLQPLPPPVADKDHSPPWHKAAAVTGLGTVALASFGVAGYYNWDAQKQRQQAGKDCETDRDMRDGTSPCNTARQVAARRATISSERANLALAVGAIATVGTLWLGNRHQRANAGGGMPRARKLSMAITTAIAAASLGLGVGYARRAQKQQRSAAAACQFGCTPEGHKLIEQAHDSARVANLSFITAGAAAIGTGLLWLSAPTSAAGADEGNPIQLTPDIGIGHVGARLHLKLP